MNSARVSLFVGLYIFGLMLSQTVHAQPGEKTGFATKAEILENDRIYQIYMNRYQPKQEAVQYLSAYTDSVKLMVFLGDWCRESKKYIPGLMKTLELAASDFISTTYIFVDRQKKVPVEFLKMFDIEYIPSVVVLKGNMELGRIVEEPHQLIETDLVQILKSGIEKKE